MGWGGEHTYKIEIIDSAPRVTINGPIGETFIIHKKTGVTIPWEVAGTVTLDQPDQVWVESQRPEHSMAIYTVNRVISLHGINLELIPMPPGTFTMGSHRKQRHWEYNETPLTEVKISQIFWLSKYEVTQRQWGSVFRDNPSYYQGSDELPVNYVPWDDAVAFCERLNEFYASQLPQGYQFGLPTEAQWEYACRAGTSTRFSYGDDVLYKQLHLYGNFRPYGNDNADGYEMLAPVGSFLPNPWGLHDMHGNVMEWCSDLYLPADFLPGGKVIDPLGPAPGSGYSRVVRGGSAHHPPQHLRSSSRGGGAPPYPGPDIGFRVALKFNP